MKLTPALGQANGLEMIDALALLQLLQDDGLFG